MHRYHLHKLSQQTPAQQKHVSNCNQDTNSAQDKIFIIATGGVTVCCADVRKPVYCTYERSRFASFTWTQSSDWNTKALGRVPRISSLWVIVLCWCFCQTSLCGHQCYWKVDMIWKGSKTCGCEYCSWSWHQSNSSLSFLQSLKLSWCIVPYPEQSQVCWGILWSTYLKAERPDLIAKTPEY